ncbi:hypothetical protein ASG11_09605 [Sphingomonas sp. Leaf357]|uniref:DUF2171 domain-containing protein n=1 Tax=Sphingomonas sp. Leaf357 TaxID=1736350 RepID=UPI0006F6A554|nr:DUF2171 domain-containing protein [Sphingomonas sp. Leaf357]KQS04472.1 hypothetical protein ASG11_09605 [Sphingomonas sp. Leaf357]
MGYDRNYPTAGSQGEYFGAREPWDTDHQSHRLSNGNYSSAEDYAAAGQYGDSDRGGYGRGNYGAREYGNSRYGQRDQQNAGRGFQNRQRGPSQPYYGSYAHDGHRFTDEEGGRDYYRPERNPGQHRDRQQGYGRQPQGYDYDDRGFFARAGDEVRSWFGDDEAERRRDLDARYDERAYGQSGYGQSAYGRDDDYHQWRKGQIDALDRDYHEYRQENRTKFENEFGSWRTERQTQRGSLSQVREHQEVVGSDGEHIGTVDKVRGDRILLTKSDADAGGRHHSIPSRWIDKVDDKVTVRKTAEEAKAHWRDEENNQALFGDNTPGNETDNNGPRVLNRSFSGTY